MTYRVAVRYHDCSIKHLITAIHIPSAPYDRFVADTGYSDNLHAFPGSPVILLWLITWNLPEHKLKAGKSHSLRRKSVAQTA